MAQLLNHAQLKQKALQQCVKPDQKRSEDFVEAKDLTYANPQGWKFGKNSVELISTKTLKVDGKYTKVETLEMGDYEVYFELVLKNNFNIMTPVEFTLTVGDKKDVKTEYLNNYPRNQSLWIKAGEFTKALGTPGTIQFGFNGTETYTVKEGMVVEGVLIIKSSD